MRPINCDQEIDPKKRGASHSYGKLSGLQILMRPSAPVPMAIEKDAMNANAVKGTKDDGVRDPKKPMF